PGMHGTMLRVMSLQESRLLRGRELNHGVGHAQRTRDLIPKLVGIASPCALCQNLPQQSDSKIAVNESSLLQFRHPVSFQVRIKLFWSVIGIGVVPVGRVEVIG